MPSRTISILVIGVAVAIILTAGVLAYTSTLRQAGSQPSQVTWWDQNGNPITSVTLASSDGAPRSQTVSFTCSPSVGPVILRLSSTVSSLSVSRSDFAFCSLVSNSVVLTVSAGNSVGGTATIQVVDSTLYQDLSGELTITVRVS